LATLSNKLLFILSLVLSPFLFWISAVLKADYLENKENGKWYKLLKNKILQIKRPETYWNKGDYTWDEEKDLFLELNPLFAKFENDEEIYDYQISFDDWSDSYKEWFDKNSNKFTWIKL
jgi:hypothetical protein